MLRSMKLFPEIVFAPILIVLFLITRFYNLMSLPIFTDEAIYTRWAQIARFDPNWRFISLTDGKQPSFIWADMIIMKFFSDPLMAGRVVSIFAGLVTIIGIYFLTYELFKNHKNIKAARIMGVISATILVFFPFSLVYDRMALYDSLVAAFFVWTLFFQVLLVRRIRFDIAMILGFVLGGAVLTKSSGFLSMAMTPFLLVLFDFRKKDLKGRLIKFLVYSLVGVGIAYGMYSILRLSPFYHIISEKNSVFIYPVSEWMKFLFWDKIHNFQSNTMGLWDWFFTYFTIPYAVLVVASFFLTIRFAREKVILLLWFILPFLVPAIFGKTLYPRYILFMVMPLIPLVSLSLYTLFEKFKNKIIRVAIIFVVLLIPLRMDYYILTDFARAPIPRLDLEQYVNGWPAGGGVRESVEFFKEQAENGPIYIATQGTFGLMPASYEIYLIQNHRITIKGFWPTNEKIDEEVALAALKMPTYFVFYQDCALCGFPGKAPLTWPLKEISTYKKGIGNTKLTVYQVIPSK